MRNITLDGKEMPSRKATHLYLKQKFNFPEYYGENLDALWDLLTTVGSPTQIRLLNHDLLDGQLGEYGSTLMSVLQAAAHENKNLSLEIVSSDEPDSIIHTKEQLEGLMAEEETYILYFSSKNCNVCHVILPKLLHLVENHFIKVAQINIDEVVEVTGRFLVFTVPTILIMHEGKEVLRESRFIDLQAVERILNLLTRNKEDL